MNKLLFMQFELGGITCARWFDRNGLLNVYGPNQAVGLMSDYLGRYASKIQLPSVIEFLEAIQPNSAEDMIHKKHAMLHLFEEYKDEIAGGMGISHELVRDVMATCEPIDLPPEDDKAFSSSSSNATLH